MFKKTYIIIWSENPDELMKFYRDVLTLKLTEKVDIKAKDGIAADYGYEFILTEKNDYVWIGYHSEIKGKSKEPTTKTPFYKPERPWYVSTFLDPDGNAWQFMGTLARKVQG